MQLSIEWAYPHSMENPMQELCEGICHNLLPGAKLDNPDDIGANRARHLGAMMLGHFTEALQSPAEFAKKATRYRPHSIQSHMLNTAATKERVLILHAPGTGASTAGALFAMHRIMARRNHRALIISPERFMLNVCWDILRSNSYEMIDAQQLFCIRTETGYWATEEAEWGVHWAAFDDLPVHHIPNMIREEHTVIVDNAHQYSPEFLLLLQAAIQPHQQLIVIGRDTNRVLQKFENDPEFTTVRARIDQSPLISAGFVNAKREQYRDYPDEYEQIFQMPISWEPTKCPA